MERISHPQAKEAKRRIAYVRQANAIADYYWDEGIGADLPMGRDLGKKCIGRKNSASEGFSQYQQVLVTGDQAIRLPSQGQLQKRLIGRVSAVGGRGRRNREGDRSTVRQVVRQQLFLFGTSEPELGISQSADQLGSCRLGHQRDH